MVASRRAPLTRHLALGLLVGFGGLSVAGFVVTRSTVRDQERQLLTEKVAEVSLVLTSAVVQATAALGVLGETYTADPGGPGFAAGAQSLIRGDVIGVGVAEVDAAEVVGRAGVSGPPTNETTKERSLDGQRAAVLRRASDEEGVTTGLIAATPATGATFIVALGLAGGTTIYEETRIDPTQPAPRPADSPLHGLDVALYRSPEPRPDQLVVTTTADLTFSGMVDRRTLAVGTEQWLLVTAADGRLVGSFAASVPWIILGGGLAATLLAAAVVEILVRRRQHTLVLVDERTVALRQSVEELGAARAVADAATRSESEFQSHLSHELRTPLNAVLGFAQLLDLQPLCDDDREAVAQILEGGNHLLELINEVRDASRSETGDVVLSPEPVLMGERVSGVLRPAQASAIQ